MTISAPPQSKDAPTKKRASLKAHPGLPLKLKLKRNDSGGVVGMKNFADENDDGSDLVGQEQQIQNGGDMRNEVLDTRYITSS